MAPPLHVIILAAGVGKRMHSDRPKVLHPLAGRPLLTHVVDTVHTLGAEKVHIVHGHGGDQVKAAMADYYVEWDAERDLEWVEQTERLGTGHAVQQAMPGVPDDAAVLVLYGDVPLTQPDTLRSAADLARSGHLAIVTVELEDPTGYGRILRDDSGNVLGIVEHKDATVEQQSVREINTGIVAAPVAPLRDWLERIGNDNAQGEYYLTDIVAMAVGDGVEVVATMPVSPDDVLGVNDRLQLAHLERVLQRRLAEDLMRQGATLLDPARIDIRGQVTVGRDVTIDINAVFEGDVTLGDGVSIGPNTWIKSSALGAGTTVLGHCFVEHSHIGTDCRIGPFARIRPDTHLDERVHVGNFVEVKNTRIGTGSKANHLTYLGDTDVGERVNVGAGTITCNYDGANKHRTVIGDRAFIGSGVELVAPVTVEADATIGAGSTISRDAPAGQLSIARSRQTSIAGWNRPVKKR